MPSNRIRREFGRLYEGVARHLWIVASATAPRGQVDDVLQESALIGLSRFASFRRGSHFGAWMAQIVRHVSLNQMRKAARTDGALEVEQVADDLLDRPPAVPPACDARGTMGDEQAHFDDALAAGLRNLAPDARACLLLHVVEGMQQVEIAGLLGLPVGTVASHVHRSRAALREHLSPAESTRPRSQVHGGLR